MKNKKQRLAATLSAALITSAALPLATAATEYTDYTVKQGDNLYRLAIQFNTTVDEIVAANNIANRNIISVNQYLSIPTNTKTESSGSTSTPNTGSTSTQYYYVLKNDTLYSIAQKFGVTVSQLATWNNISNVDFIREGALLRVGTTSSGSTGSGSTGSTGSTATGDYYQVQKNDSLSKIAAMYGTTVAQLAAWNNISNVNFIREGAILRVSYSSGSTGSTGGSTGSGSVSSNQHVVVAGDNLYRLAITYGTTVSQLAAWNNISNVRLIHVGDVLQVGAGAVVDGKGSTIGTMSATVELPTTTPVVATVTENVTSYTPTVTVTAPTPEIEEVVETETPEVAETVAPEVAETVAPEVVEAVAPEVADTASATPDVVLPVSELELTTTVAEEATDSINETLSATVKTYTVTEATTVFHLAALFNTPAGSLISWNDLEDNNLTVGMEVIIAQ